jgi:hypothetical protein
MIEQYASFFKKNKYVVVPNFISRDVTLLLYEYMKTKALRESLKYTYFNHIYHNKWDGEFTDPQAENSYSFYGDPVFDTVLNLSNNNVGKCVGLDLTPQYSYWRLYETGNQLKKHKDRASCEISATICLGYDISNLKDKLYNWPMYIDGKPIHLNPGDILLYKGCEVEHWRDIFQGLNQAQAFLHYNDNNGLFYNKYDTRECLGIPK